jgi:hypothetical protein
VRRARVAGLATVLVTLFLLALVGADVVVAYLLNP